MKNLRHWIYFKKVSSAKIKSNSKNDKAKDNKELAFCQGEEQLNLGHLNLKTILNFQGAINCYHDSCPRGIYLNFDFFPSSLPKTQKR
jgi:hypothetical protein